MFSTVKDVKYYQFLEDRSDQIMGLKLKIMFSARTSLAKQARAIMFRIGLNSLQAGQATDGGRRLWI